jgi:hypothetical protein
MHSLDAEGDVRNLFPGRADICDEVTGGESCNASVVDVHQVRRHRGELAPVKRGVGSRDERPYVRVGGRFVGDVSGVDVFEGGVEVVEVEHKARCDPVVGVDLDEGEHLRVKHLWLVFAHRQTDTTED